MRVWLKRIGIALVSMLVVVAIGLAVWEPLTARAPVAVAYTPTDVRIARDAYGVPHIFGRTDADVAYGVAYAHAEDDFSTLQEVLAMTRGRLGAMTGADGAKTDFAGYVIDGRGTVNRHYAELPDDVKALFVAYAAGLNRYAERHPDEVRLSGLFPVRARYAERHPDEVRLSGLFPVRAEDVVAGFVIRSPFFFGLDQTLGALVEGTPLRREGGPPIPDVPARTAQAPASTRTASASSTSFAGSLLGNGEGENGSNAYAVAPRRTSDGATWLVSNSHQPWTGGVAWYELASPVRPIRFWGITAIWAGPTPSTGPTSLTSIA